MLLEVVIEGFSYIAMLMEVFIEGFSYLVMLMEVFTEKFIYMTVLTEGCQNPVWKWGCHSLFALFACNASGMLSISGMLWLWSICCRSAIEEGKGIFYNIRNFVRFQMST